MERTLLSLILAAGEGTRMRSQKPKVLHEVAGLPMVGHVIRSVQQVGGTKTAVVVGNAAERVAAFAKSLDESAETFIQEERLGTAHAALAARKALEEGADDIIVCYGDTPLVRPKLFQSIRESLADGADVAVLGFETDNPFGYGRLLMKGDALVAIREEKDATEEERKVTLCNSGIMGLRGNIALSVLDAITNDNVKGEYYLTDAVEVAVARGLNVRSVVGPEEDTLGVNSRVELAEAESVFQSRLRKTHMMNGVTLTDPASTFFSYDTEIGSDTLIEPNCVFAPGVKIAGDVTIKANSYFEGDLKKGLLVEVASGSVIGPFARLRPGAKLQSGAKVGNFCEVKNAKIGEDAKVNHLTYIGDASVGARSNIGAGTVTCNYDGFNKHHTEIGEDVFIGTHSSLVAPVTIESGAYTATGSVITKDVESDSLAIARGRQENKEGWAKKFRNRHK